MNGIKFKQVDSNKAIVFSLGDVEKTNKIYKFIKLEYLLSSLQGKILRINQIMHWEDVYENFFLKQQFIENNSEISTGSVMERMYGQSWTTLPESDALWRIYSGANKDAIRVSITIDKLIEILDSNWMVYIGNVTYKKREEISQYIQDFSVISYNDLQSIVAGSLFIKRKEFEHESEFRIIVFRDTTQPLEKYLECDINNDFYDDFCLDPRMSKEQREIISRILNKSFGVPNEKIKESSLYTFDEIKEIKIK